MVNGQFADECRMDDAIASSRTFPGVFFVATDTAVLGTRLTPAEMEKAGWFSKRPPVGIAKDGKKIC